MFDITIVNVAIYGVCFILFFYLAASLWYGKFISVDWRKLFLYITIFSLFGVVGEIFVNTLYGHFFGERLWEYHLYPVHDGHISKMFIFVWGSLGVYKYLSEIAFSKFRLYKKERAGLIMSLEAIFLELWYNVTFFILFGGYIFYYFPANLGPLSHFSCLQVLPFYFIFGFLVMKIVSREEKAGFSKTRLSFFWFILLTLVFLV